MHGDYSPAQGPADPRCANGAIGGGGLMTEKAYLDAQNRLKQSQVPNTKAPRAAPSEVQGLETMLAINLDASRSVYLRARNLRDRLAGVETSEENDVVAPSLGGPTKDSLQSASYYHEEAARILEQVYLYLFN